MHPCLLFITKTEASLPCMVTRTTIGILLVLFMGFSPVDAWASGFSECVKDTYPLPTTGLEAFRNGQEKHLAEDFPGAAALYLQAAKEGNWQAELALIELFIQRRLYVEDIPHLGPLPDIRLARLVKKGIPEAAAMRASATYMLMYGNGDEDPVELYKNAANMGSRTAQLFLGIIPTPGFTDADMETCLRCAYSQGSRFAARELSTRLLMKGQTDEALHVAHAAAIMGDTLSLFMLHLMYERKRFDAITSDLARRYFTKADCLISLYSDVSRRLNFRDMPGTEALFPYLGTIPDLDTLCP